MENVCKMDCHSCTLQEGNANKALCATLFMPAMLNMLSMQLHQISTAIGGNSAVKLNEVILGSEVKQINEVENESIEE